MKIFITGGTGFIGTPLVEELTRRGHAVLLLVPPSETKKETKKKSGIRIVEGKLADCAVWEKAVRRFKPDAAIHLAWEGIPDYGAHMSTKNVVQSLPLVDMLARAGCKKFLGIGTCWEYGKGARGKLKETAPLDIEHVFPAAKTALHMLGREVARSRSMQFFWARPFFVYGPGQKSASLIPSVIASLKQGERPALNNPHAGQDFVYVTDVARAVADILEKSKKDYAVYNIGSGVLTGVGRIADMVGRAYGVSAQKKKGSATPKGFWADISLMKKEIGWRPVVSLSEGIKEVVRIHGI